MDKTGRFTVNREQGERKKYDFRKAIGGTARKLHPGKQSWKLCVLLLGCKHEETGCKSVGYLSVRCIWV